jgi:hypothetical protein
LRAEFAKEEYATTWQEEEQGEPQEDRVPRPEVYGRAQRKALDTLTRVTQDECTKECGSKRGSAKRGGQTRHQAERHGPQGFADSPSRGRSSSRRSHCAVRIW